MGRYLTHVRASIAVASVYDEVERPLHNWDELLVAGAHDARVALSALQREFGLTMQYPGFDETIFTQETWRAAIDAQSQAIRRTLLWKHVWLYVTCAALLARCGIA